jgi:hypothetical protein
MGGVETELHTFLTSALDGMGGQLNSPAALPPEKEPSSPRNPLDRGWVDPRTCLDAMGLVKMFHCDYFTPAKVKWKVVPVLN